MQSNVKHLSLLASCQKKKKVVFMLWVGREFIIVMLAQKKKRHRNTHTHTDTHTHTHISDQIVTKVTSSEKNLWFLGTVRSIKKCETSKRENVIQCIGSLCFAFLSYFFLFLKSGMCFFNKQVEPHVTCSMIYVFFCFLYVTAWKPRSNLWMYPFTLFFILFHFCWMFSVF